MAGEIKTPVLLIHGEKAHSRYFSEGAFAKLKGDNKELLIIPGAVHTDRSNAKITVPTAFFKAVLRYSSNTTIGENGYCATAFLFDHEEYSKSDKSGLKVNKSMSMSVKDLEAVLGYKLFVNLDSVIGADKADAVKSQNPQSNNWWWK